MTMPVKERVISVHTLSHIRLEVMKCEERFISFSQVLILCPQYLYQQEKCNLFKIKLSYSHKNLERRMKKIKWYNYLSFCSEHWIFFLTAIMNVARLPYLTTTDNLSSHTNTCGNDISQPWDKVKSLARLCWTIQWLNGLAVFPSFTFGHCRPPDSCSAEDFQPTIPVEGRQQGQNRLNFYYSKVAICFWFWKCLSFFYIIVDDYLVCS